MHGSRNKIPGKNLVRQRCAEGFNSGVKGLIACLKCVTVELICSTVVLEYDRRFSKVSKEPAVLQDSFYL
jgi:hypothetical protein